MTAHPSRDWSDKGGPFVRDQDNDENGIERDALDILARLNPRAAGVMRVQGRHVSDRYAAEAQARRDHIETSNAIAELVARRPRPNRQMTPMTEHRRREILTARRPAPDDYPGKDRDLEAGRDESWRHYLNDRYGLGIAGDEPDRWADIRPPDPGDFPAQDPDGDELMDGAWRRYLAGRYGLDVDDATHDAWLDEQAAEAPEDLHYRSPDLDDIPTQRTDDVQEQIR